MKFSKKSFITGLFTLVLFFNSFSQNDVPKKYHLKHEMSPAEKELMKTYSQTRSFYETDPPTGEVRNITKDILLVISPVKIASKSLY